MSSFFDRITNSFSSSSQKNLFNQIMTSQYHLHAKYEPIELKKILNNKSTKQYFIKELSTCVPIYGNNINSQKIKEFHLNNSIFKTLKKLSIFHHLVIYYHDFAELIEVVDVDGMIDNLQKNQKNWFVTNVIRPYVCFLKKYCLSIEVYQKLRSMPCGSKQSIFQCLYYSINIFRSLFTVVNKLSNIGRYFREKFPKTIDYFVELMAYHSQLIYQGFRSCISEIISFSKNFLSKKDDEVIIKEILLHDLPWINQQMKKLFLDKYFYPYGKGYGVKLYRVQEQNQYQSQIIDSIMNGHERTERQKQSRMLEQTLFPTNNQKKFTHEDLQQSFSFSLSKLQHLREQNKKIINPEKEFNRQKKLHNYSMQKLDLGFAKKSPKDDHHNKKEINFTAVQGRYEEQVVEDV